MLAAKNLTLAEADRLTAKEALVLDGLLAQDDEDDWLDSYAEVQWGSWVRVRLYWQGLHFSVTGTGPELRPQDGRIRGSWLNAAGT